MALRTDRFGQAEQMQQSAELSCTPAFRMLSPNFYTWHSAAALQSTPPHGGAASLLRCSGANARPAAPVLTPFCPTAIGPATTVDQPLSRAPRYCPGLARNAASLVQRGPSARIEPTILQFMHAARRQLPQ